MKEDNKIEVGSEVMYNDSKTVVTGKKGAMFTVRDWEHPIHESYLTLVSKAPESDLRVENVRGNLFAIECNKKELSGILDLLGFANEKRRGVNPGQEPFYIYANSMTWDCFKDDVPKSYKIVTASQFIAANSESDKGEVKNLIELRKWVDTELKLLGYEHKQILDKIDLLISNTYHF